MITEVTTSNEPDASRSAGIQKRAKNLAADELLIEVMKIEGECYSVKMALNIPITNDINIKSIFKPLMFG